MDSTLLEPATTVIPLVNDIINQGITQGASDIHWEPYADHLLIRFRQDGLLHPLKQQPTSIAHKIISRLKVLASLDIAEKRLPQDGHFSWQSHSGHSIDCRISTCPTLYGEKIVLRLLDSQQQQLAIDDLGLLPTQLPLFQQAIQQPQGLILVTGPTGSGKTVSLYSALAHLNQPHRNISTIEDPVEIKLSGINQVSVQPKIGLTFAVALRAFLRQDPDVIMVGEMRDLETAEIAIKAAQTGHLVLSTLHTNSAAESIARLLNMGIPTYQIVNCFHLIIAQRLARQLCSHCKIKQKAPPFIETTIIYQANRQGCEQCHGGYRGRLGIYELLPFKDELKQILLQQNPNALPSWLANNQFMTLQQAGMKKVQQGLTSLDEIDRITMTDDTQKS